MAAYRCAPRNPRVPIPTWFALARRGAPLAEFALAGEAAVIERQPLAAARSLLRGAGALGVSAWVDAEFPPRSGSHIGRGQLLFLNGGLEFRPLPVQDSRKELLDAGLTFADIVGLSEMTKPFSDLVGMMAEEIASSPARTRPSTFIPFVEIVEVAYRQAYDHLDCVTVAREDEQGARTGYHFAPMKSAWPGLIMAARFEVELDFLRAEFLRDVLDLAAIEETIIGRARTRYGDLVWPDHRTDLLAEAAAVAEQQLTERTITAGRASAAILEQLAPLLPEYRQTPELAGRIAALEAAAGGEGEAAVAPIPIGRDEAARLFCAIAQAVPEGIIQSVAFSPDGRQALRGGSAGWLCLWEAASGRIIRRWPADEQAMRPVWRVAISPDGRMALSAGEDGAVRLWDLADGRQIRRLGEHGGTARSVAFSADGRQVISGGLDGRIYVWDAVSGRQARRLVGLPPIRCVAFSTDGRHALAGDEAGQVGVFPVSGWRGLFYCRERHAGPVYDIAPAPDGRRALSAGADGAVRLWDIERRRELRRFEGHSGGVQSVVFTPDGRRALSAGDDNTVRLWDVESGRELRRYAEPEPAPLAQLFGVSCSPDGRWALACGSGRQRVVLWRFSD